jgi:hypothetical protein
VLRLRLLCRHHRHDCAVSVLSCWFELYLMISLLLLAPVVSLSGRLSHGCAAEGQLLVMGRNARGQLGRGHRSDQLVPAVVGQRELGYVFLCTALGFLLSACEHYSSSVCSLVLCSCALPCSDHRVAQVACGLGHTICVTGATLPPNCLIFFRPIPFAERLMRTNRSSLPANRGRDAASDRR